jgi:retron-type reverse transcriptase
VKNVKTFKHLYPQITAFENLYPAYKKAARAKRGKADVAAFEFRLEENLMQLKDELENQTYQPGGYHNFRIQDPKPRLISAAPFRERVVHHALCSVIEPIFERRFIYDSYACRVGKGTHAALDRCQEFAHRYPYVLQCDVRHFFPSMDHAVLRAQLARVLADPQVMWLCDQILASGAGIHTEDYPPLYFPGDDLFAALRPRGLPIGNLTSQFWANVYLNPLDQWIKRELKCRAYLRYVDDFLLFAPDKLTLHYWRDRILDFLPSLRLKLHEERAMVYPAQTGIPFLGWRVYPDGHRRLKRRNGIAFQRRYKRLITRFAAGEINLEKLDQSVQGWIAHVRHGQTWGLRSAILGRPILPQSSTLMSDC